MRPVTVNFGAVGALGGPGRAASELAVPDVERRVRESFDRARREGRPLLVLRVEVDGLARHRSRLGPDAAARILTALERLLEELVPGRDHAGMLGETGLVALVPGTPPERSEDLARTLLERARALRVEGRGVEGRGEPLRVGLSIGLAHTARRGDPTYDTVLHVAEEGVRVARASGGGRVVHTELYNLFQAGCDRAPGSPGVATRAGGGAAGGGSDAAPAPVAAPAPAVPAQRQPALEDTVAIIRAELQKSYEGKLQGHQEEVDILKRRISKLNVILDETEGELRRVMLLKSVDPGIASVYRSVQGLAEGDPDFELKHKLMTSIFEANLMLARTFGRPPVQV